MFPGMLNGFLGVRTYQRCDRLFLIQCGVNSILAAADPRILEAFSVYDRSS